MIKRLEKSRKNKYIVGRPKNPDVVLIIIEVDAGLPTYRSIHHGKQGGRNINQGNAPFKSAGSKTSYIQQHTSSQGDHQALTVSPFLLQVVPYLHHGFQPLVGLSLADNDLVNLLPAQEFFYQRQTLGVGIVIAYHENAAGRQRVYSF